MFYRSRTEELIILKHSHQHVNYLRIIRLFRYKNARRKVSFGLVRCRGIDGERNLGTRWSRWFESTVVGETEPGEGRLERSFAWGQADSVTFSHVVCAHVTRLRPAYLELIAHDWWWSLPDPIFWLDMAVTFHFCVFYNHRKKRFACVMRIESSWT